MSVPVPFAPVADELPPGTLLHTTGATRRTSVVELHGPSGHLAVAGPGPKGGPFAEITTSAGRWFVERGPRRALRILDPAVAAPDGTAAVLAEVGPTRWNGQRDGRLLGAPVQWRGRTWWMSGLHWRTADGTVLLDVKARGVFRRRVELTVGERALPTRDAILLAVLTRYTVADADDDAAAAG